MKHFAFASRLCIALPFTTGKKWDACPGPPTRDRTCDLVQSTFFINAFPEEDRGIFTEYRNEYGNDGKVSNVVAGLFKIRVTVY